MSRDAAPDEERPRRGRRWLRWLWILGATYLGVTLVFVFFENQFIYHPVSDTREWIEPPDPRLKDVFVRAATGEMIHAWWLPVEKSECAVLYSHGNAGNLSHRGRSMARWAEEMRYSVLIYDYPGYGRSQGKPSEKGCYASCEAAWKWLTTEGGIRPENVLFVGGSLGGAMAVDMAARGPGKGLVLNKAFTSVPDMAQVMFPWLPARFFVRHRFDNLEKMPRVHMPVFIVHGTWDRVVPFEQGQRLFEAANEPKTFLQLPGHDHETSLPADFFEKLKAFLRQSESSTG